MAQSGASITARISLEGRTTDKPAATTLRDERNGKLVPDSGHSRARQATPGFDPLAVVHA
jgi:hypothetical protein